MMKADGDPLEILRDLPLFEGLKEADLKRVADLARPQRVRKGTNLIALEQRGYEVYLIVEGTVRVQVEQQDGSRVILAFLGAGDLVGEMGVVERSTRSATVKTIEDCHLLWFERSAFNSCLREIPRLAWNLSGIMSRRLRLANARIQLMGCNVATRLARQLLAFGFTMGLPQEDGSILIPLRLTQTDLADLIGASRERVNKIVGTWRDKGIVDVDADYRITLVQPNRLDELYPC
jgi:CRP/FNR family cyclic AMP-dependent transcriptional regulator